MKHSSRNGRALPWVAAIFVLLATASLGASEHRPESWARSQFASAERLHQALEARPAQDLTRADYLHAINAYRRIFLESPTSTKADPSVVAVAQLLEEMGRRFEDDDVLREAIQQYEFLRKQYPGSKGRFAALFHIGEIYKDDLHDKQRAQETFEEFLHRYPRNAFAEQAQKALAELNERPDVRSASKTREKSKAVNRAQVEEPKVPSNDEESKAESPAPGKLVRVLGVRHWTTSDGVRVAIDLRGTVKFDSQQIDHPNRVFFDLFDTKVNLDLLGKSFDLQDQLVKRIRISQYKPRQTRVVFEVDEGAEVGATLEENPPRLVVNVWSNQQAKSAGHKSAESQDLKAAAMRPARESDSSKEEIADAKPGKEVPAQPLLKSAVKALGAGMKGCGGKDSAECDEAENKPTNRTVVTSTGVKKTIVDADEDEDAPATVARAEFPQPAKPKAQTTAKSKLGLAKKKSSAEPVDVREAQPTASGDRSLIRALGLKIGKIVIDPGHGGHDTGTIGPHGLLEKDIVLDVSTRLGKLLENRLGAEIVYTRADDTFIPLETRTAIANQEGADLFISVHANSSGDPDARGVETYYLNFTSSPEALEVAARENAVSEKSIHELQDLVKKIALKEKIEESREFAVDVDHSLHSGLTAKNPGLRDRGVKKAPFIVLIGANMPSILAEISFLSNPGDEKRLKTAEYRQRIAESLYRGIAKYVNGLSGVKVASKIEKDQGQ